MLFQLGNAWHVLEAVGPCGKGQMVPGSSTGTFKDSGRWSDCPESVSVVGNCRHLSVMGKCQNRNSPSLQRYYEGAPSIFL